MRTRGPWIIVVFSVTLLAGCAGRGPATPNSTPSPAVSPTPLDRWDELFLRTPHPFTTPLPPAEPGALDGTYIKTVVTDTPVVHCRRCPDYAPAGGLWKLSFSKGIFRLYHADSGWRSLGSFTVEGEALALFNDPNCTALVGRYTWTKEDGQLVLTAVDDPCAIELRAMNLTELPWESCQPPNEEAAVSGHWMEPEGCGR